MNRQLKHAIGIFVVGFLLFAPAFAVASNSIVLSQDLDEDFLVNLLSEGAELVLANINDEGAPAVIYGQLGVPSEVLDLDNTDLYGGCIAMALVATHGEFLDYVFELIGFESDGSTDGDGGFIPAQDGGGFDMDSILDVIGTEFRLLVNIFIDTPEATSATRMNNILTHLSGPDVLGFSFAQLFTLRIDEETIPPEADVELPFESLDIYIHSIAVDFSQTVSSVLGLMDDSGFIPSIDQAVFTDSPAAAAGLLAVPDVSALETIFGNLTGGNDAGEFQIAEDFIHSQFPDIEGPLAIAAAGYIGEQILSNDDTELKIFEDLFGASGTIGPMDSGLSMVIGNMPENVNISSYTPNAEADNHSFWEEGSTTVIWNATGIGDVDDYVISFEGDDFPPPIAIDRTFSSDSVGIGSSVEVTVTVTNEGTEPISDLKLNDTGFAQIYSSATVTGTTTAEFTTLNGGASESITYTVTFQNEGRYTFPKAVLEYTFDSKQFDKDTTTDYVDVVTDPGSVFAQGIMDGYPYTLGIIGLIALVGVIQIVRLVKGGGGDASTYQV